MNYSSMLLTFLSEEYTPGHLPDVSDIESMTDVLTLCNYCILSNVLDFCTYGFSNGYNNPPSPRDHDQREVWDRNALSLVDRKYFIYVCGLAINLIRWLGCNFDATSVQGTSPVMFEKHFCGLYLIDQACAILNYKKKAEEENLATIPWCKFKDIDRQLEFVFHRKDDEEPWFGDWPTKKADFKGFSRLAFTKAYIISRKASPL